MRREARLLHDPAERDRDSSGGSFLSTLGLAQSAMFAVFTICLHCLSHICGVPEFRALRSLLGISKLT